MTKAKPTLGEERVTYSIRGLWDEEWADFESNFPSLKAAIEFARNHHSCRKIRIARVTSVDVAEVTR